MKLMMDGYRCLKKKIDLLKFKTGEIAEIKEIKDKDAYRKGVYYCYLNIDGRRKI